jgi:hypothetical protein
MKKLSMVKGSVRVRWSPQVDGFSTCPGDSMKYLLLLNGVADSFMSHNSSDTVQSKAGMGPKWLIDAISHEEPSALPGHDGPIVLVLIL